MLAENKFLIRRFFQAVWMEHNFDFADMVVSPDYVEHTGGHERLPIGPAAIRHTISEYEAAFPSFVVSTIGLLAEGDKVVVQWELQGFHQGEQIL